MVHHEALENFPMGFTIPKPERSLQSACQHDNHFYFSCGNPVMTQSKIGIKMDGG
jgi:hypothetical protein